MKGADCNTSSSSLKNGLEYRHCGGFQIQPQGSLKTAEPTRQTERHT